MAWLAIAGGCAPHQSTRRPDIHQLMEEAIAQNAQQPQGVLIDETAECQLKQTATTSDGLEAFEVLPLPVLEPPEEPLLLSEEFIETDIREALFLLAEEAGVQVLLDEQVRGVVNLSLEEVTFEEALERLLLPLNYVFVRQKKRYLIAPPDPKSPLFYLIAEQVEYRPQHLPAKTLLATTPRSMKDFVREVEGANALLIYAPKQYNQLLLEQFQRLDQPIPQVVLEAVICVVSPDCGFRFGVNWGHAVELDGKSALDLGVSGLAMNTQFSPAGFDAMFRDFSTTSVFIKKLAEHGYLTIRAAPRVMAKDGEQANIAINRETFFSVQPLPGGASGGATPFFVQQDIQKVEAGISLDITPRIRGDVVTIDIEKAEVSEDIRNANIELSVNPYPIINRRSVSTTVDVQDGRTIVIGGLVQRETVDRTNQVPGMSSLPVVGRLFKNTQSQTREVEVVIFISPKIIDPLETCTASIIPEASTMK
jgi:type II secretory pathway component GspD/PulD (secretin)